MINEKGIYGLASGVVTTMLLQPFENIKMALMLPPHRLKELHAQSSVFNNIATSCEYINEKDGVKGYYKGLVAACMKAGIGCYIYFTGLKYFEKPEMSPAENFIASSVSRLTSTFLTNPLSIIETRFELAYFHGYTSVWAAVKDIYKNEGSRAFFTGGLSSCIKEGMFGGFHYMFYLELKDIGAGTILAGITSGMMATVITHPFEIIRARLQTQGLTDHHPSAKHPIYGQMKEFLREGGWFKGVAPRLVKKPLANMLTFLFFESFQERDSKKQ